VTRAELFARDDHRCVYCGEAFPPEALSVDHVQPRMRGGDQSGGNLVTACQGCNTAKGGQPLAAFLAANPLARRNFFRLARYVWPRHLRAVAEALVQAGAIVAPPGGVGRLQAVRSAAALATLLEQLDRRTDPPAATPDTGAPPSAQLPIP
jgi:hypothetical protein